jgi:hypothetical protein
MLARASFVAVLLSLGIYGFGWLATATPFFQSRQRVRCILLRAILALASVVLTVTILALVITVERH